MWDFKGFFQTYRINIFSKAFLSNINKCHLWPLFRILNTAYFNTEKTWQKVHFNTCFHWRRENLKLDGERSKICRNGFCRSSKHRNLRLDIQISVTEFGADSICLDLGCWVLPILVVGRKCLTLKVIQGGEAKLNRNWTWS